MKQMHIPRRLMLSGVAATVFAVAGLSASAQTTTTTTSASARPTSSTNPRNLTTAATATKGGATPQMIQEACQRQRARTAKFLQSGVPEQFGSEEPFKFDPTKPCP